MTGSVKQKVKMLVVGAGTVAVKELVKRSINSGSRFTFDTIKSQVMTECIISSRNEMYHTFLNWLSMNYNDKDFRKLQLVSRWYRGVDMNCATIGYGKHIVKYRGQLLFINYENNKETCDSTITLTKYGRDRKLFDQLIMDVCKESVSEDIIKLHRLNNGWEYVKDTRIRTFDSVFIEGAKRNTIVSRIKEFKGKENWYLSHGIPYQLGILLYGPAGTGKTSTIKAIASLFKYPIYYIPARMISEIEKGISTLPDNSVVVIEDIDTATMVHERNDEKDSDGSDGFLKGFGASSFADILNSLDGLFSTHGRIIIATTNYIDKLDRALIRHGRFDLKINIGYVSVETLGLFMKNFYPDSELNISIDIKKTVPMSTLQEMVMEGKTDTDVIEFMTEEIKVGEEK